VDARLVPGDGPEDAAAAVRDGRADFGMADASAVLTLKAQGMPLTIVASLGDKSPICTFSLPASRIAGPRDLAGKTVAVDPFETPRTLFPALAEASGLRQGDVAFLPMDLPRRLEALATGKVDAIFGAAADAPALQKALGLPSLGSFLWADYGFGLYGACLFARSDRVKARAMAAFLASTLRAWELSLRRPADAVAAYGKYRVVEPSGLVEELGALAPLFNTRAYRTRGIGWMDAGRMRETLAAVTGLLGVPAAFRSEDAYTVALLPRPPVRMRGPQPAVPPAAAPPGAASPAVPAPTPAVAPAPAAAPAAPSRAAEPAPAAPSGYSRTGGAAN
jgi:NitT/TauT family transport system substrate-binding protein